MNFWAALQDALSYGCAWTKRRKYIPEPQAPKTNFKRAFDEAAYSFEKIVGEVRGDSNLVVAKQAVNQLQISLNQFENLLKERGFTVDFYDSIKYLYQEIEHPLTELRRYFMKEPSEIPKS